MASIGGGSRGSGGGFRENATESQKKTKNSTFLNAVEKAQNYLAGGGGFSSGGGGKGAFGSGGGGGFSSGSRGSDISTDYSSYYGGGGGISGPQRIDLTDILASYEQGAKAQEQAVRDSGASQRQSLLDSLKRFQEETAEARNQQRRSYNSSRADLEGQAFMANRQAAQNAAARGLGGSGLQQLAQLQNLINQSAAADKLAQSNTDVLKQLATAAKNKEEDTNTSLLNLDKDIENKLATIAANNAQARANLQYQEDVRYEQARQQAEQFAAQLAASNAAAANAAKQAEKEASLADAMYNNALSGAISDARTAFNNVDDLDDLKTLYSSSLANLNSIAGQTTLSPEAIAAYRNQLENDYNNRYLALNTKDDSITLGNLINPLWGAGRIIGGIGDVLNTKVF